MSSTVLSSSLKVPVHDLGPWRLYEGLQEKAVFTEPCIFRHVSYEWKIALELEVGVKK